MFRAFDFASPDQSAERRPRTTVPQQALFSMNAPFVIEQARALAARPEVAGAPTDRGPDRRALPRRSWPGLPAPPRSRPPRASCAEPTAAERIAGPLAAVPMGAARPGVAHDE